MRQSSQASFRDWRDALWATYARLESASDSDCFFGRVMRPLVGSDSLSVVVSTAQRTERTPNNIRADPRDFVLCAIQVKGRGFVEQGDRQAATSRGEFVLYETLRPYTLLFNGPFEQVILKLPRKLLDRPVRGLFNLTGRSIPAARGAGAVAREFVEGLVRRGGELGDGDLAVLIPIAADLVANAVAAHFGDLPNDQARFDRIRQRLRTMVRESVVDIEELARSERMSPRSLQRLFQLNGTTPGRFVMDTRLEGVMRDLQGAKPRSRQIGDIALSWGFNDLSHFTRTFRVRYGATPSEFRRAPS